MKKPLILTICALPILLLIALYILLLGFGVMDGNIVGVYLIIAAVILSFVIPVVCLGLGLIWKSQFPLSIYFASACLFSVAFWAVCYVDVGDKIHQFYAA